MARRQAGEGSVYQRKADGRWIATVSDGWQDGKRQRRVFTGTSPEAAMRKRADWLDLRRDGFETPKGRPPTVGEWMSYWLNVPARDRVAVTTWEGYRSYVELRIVPYFDHVALPDLNEQMLEGFHRHLRRDLAAASVTQVHRIMSRALKVAVARGHIPRNPCLNVSPPPVERDEPEPPTAAEAARILGRCETWPNGPRWVLAIATGIRQGEALALRWVDVELGDPASITIRRSAAMVRGETEDSGPAHAGRKRTQERIVKAPKSRKSRRTIQVSATVVAALKVQRDRQVRNLGEDLVFTDEYGRPVHPRADYRDWHDLLDDLKIRRYRVHDLRHAAATYMLEDGQDIKVVSAIMGHATSHFTQQVYQHVTPQLHQRAADAMEARLRRR